MSTLKYHRPRSVDEALELLANGTPLAGGVSLTPRRRSVDAVVDLQDLGLAAIESGEGHLRVGAAASLERLRTAASLPQALAQACRHEAGLNVRNQATLGGLVHAGDGRSPLLTALLSLRCELSFARTEARIELDEYLDERDGPGPALMTAMLIDLPTAMAFEAVSRSPLDRPIVCAAAVRYEGNGAGGSGVRLALGGYGDRPLVGYAESAADPVASLVAGAREAFGDAGDAWATAAYRSDVAAALAQRLLTEVMS
jgi:CO/xanthine dehydrogenase FAD-binding subunit